MMVRYDGSSTTAAVHALRRFLILFFCGKVFGFWDFWGDILDNMTKGAGLIGLLYAFKDLIEAGAVWLITGLAVLIFFYYVVGFVGDKANIPIPGISIKKGAGGKNMLLIIFMLFIIFSIYSLIALTGAVFGVNSSPTGGLYVQ